VVLGEKVGYAIIEKKAIDSPQQREIILSVYLLENSLF